MAHPSHPLSVKALSKRFGTFEAVKNVHFDIDAGEIVALLGPSGCGKTTCLRMIAGLVDPSSGRVELGGRNIVGLPAAQRNIGMLFQNYALFPHMTVAGNIALGLEARRVSRPEIARRVQEALRMVKLEEMADRLPGRLSGGQQQRVALARAVVIEPSLLLLDEPFGALDKNLRETVQLETKSIQRRLQMTTLFVTHDQEEALTLSDRIIVMKDGELQQFATPTELYQRPANRFVAGFIGVSNFFEGQVETLGSERVLRMKDGSLIRPSTLPQNAHATALVRPESIQIEPAASATGGAVNSLIADVEQVIYRGVQTHFHLRLPDGAPIVAYRQNLLNNHSAETLAAGTKVRASWDSAAIHVLAS